MAKPSITELLESLKYFPETGKLFWLKRPLHHFKNLRSQNAWNARYAGSEAFTASKSDGYLHGLFNKKTILAHHAAWAIHYGYWPNRVDHEDGKRSNNKILNLKEMNHIENMKNKRLYSNNKSGHNGIYRLTGGRWKAVIIVNKETIKLGIFDKLEDTITARMEANKKYGFTERHGL